eukprot:284443-Amphidinium_carterae.1
MILLSTTLLRSHFATNTVELLPDYVGDAMEARYDDRVYELNEQNIEYITHLPGDTTEDDIRLRQIVHLEDDIESIIDEEYYTRRQ